MEKTIYYIECTCIKTTQFPNVTINEGEVLYFNNKASSNEMYIFNRHINPESEIIKHARQYNIFSSNSHIPFTRQKKNARKWQIKRYAEQNARWINGIGQFNAIVKEIKVTYTEEEV